MGLEAGRVLKERYRLIRPLGQGSQASVWVAEHLALSTQVAVKLIDPDLAKKEDARERFKREATAAAQLRSAHVVQMLDHGIDGEQPFIVMELLEGEDLFERLNKRGRLSLKETSKIVTQVARALTRAHQAGIVHRDLKPENVFLVPNEDDEVAKVLDFGVAKVADPARQTMKKTGVGTLIGTPHYMSSEQVKGIAELDHRSDLWSLGVIAFQCVTGEMPFDSTGVGDLLIKISVGDIPVPSKTLPGLPPGFDAWFAKACERDLARRFQTAREMAVALATLVASLEMVQKGASMRPPGRGASRPPAEPLAALAEQVAAKEVATPAPREPSATEIPTEEIAEEEPAPLSALSGVRIDPDIDADWDVPSLAGRRVPKPPSSHRGDAIAPTPTPNPFLEPIAPPHHADAPPSPPRKPTPPAPAIRAVTPPKVAFVPEAPISDRVPPNTVSGVSRIMEDPPPELDGSKRRRLGRWFAFALVAGAAVVVWELVKSQMPPPDTHAVAAPVTAAPHAVDTPVVVQEPPAPALSAIDPGAKTHPTKPTPSATTKPAINRGPVRQRSNDDSIVIPDPPAD